MIKELRKTIEKTNNLQQTENGALGYSTTGNGLVDLNFSVPSRHSNVKTDDLMKFDASLETDYIDTVKWMFFLRDIKGGLGERDSFVNLFLEFWKKHPEDALLVLHFVPEYGRWKDLFDMLQFIDDDSTLANGIYNTVIDQFKEDILNKVNRKPISLLAKWMPSINSSSKSRRIAVRVCRRMGLTFADYRKSLSELRRYLDVTEVKTCSNEWGSIDYNKVSSNANARYNNAFYKHDQDRRQQYLDDLNNPDKEKKTVMHAENLYPYEVYAKYSHDYYNRVLDPGVEAMWNNLKNIESVGSCLVVCDGSGSMTANIPGSKSEAIDVSRSLSVFFSERCSGEYKDKVIEFSRTPRYIDLSDCGSLFAKVRKLHKYNDCSNTNIEKVFDLVLKTAVDNHLPQTDLPDSILIVSDMEFDCACEYSVYSYGVNDVAHMQVMNKYKTLFETIGEKWSALGYKLPKLVFWNVMSRTNTVPVSENEAGVILVSGFSVNNIKLVMSGETDPYKALKTILDGERYTKIEKALQ